MRSLIRYGLYPVLLVLTLGAALFTLNSGGQLQRAFAYFTAARLALLLAVEWRYPASKAWGMNWRRFLRDMKYTAVLSGLSYGAKFAAGWLAIGLADNHQGALSQWPLVLQIVTLVLFYEFFQYWLHRYSHEARGTLGRFLWRTHVQHHMPRGVYLIMHVVMHPINLALAIGVSFGSVYVLGVGKDAAFLFNVILGLQALVSHFNVQINAGWFNYVFVGTELHRNHHSATLSEAGNFGVLTPFWDLVFGTFRYTPDRLPQALGVSEPERYPGSNQLWAAMSLPFRSTDQPVGTVDEP